MKRILLAASLCAALVAAAGCARFNNPAGDAKAERLVVISQVYNEIIWALGAQGSVVGVDYSSTYPPDVKKVQTVGYHRALSAEGILSLHPTAILHDNNIGPPQVVEQLKGLNIPMKTFDAKNDSVDGTKALIREMGAYFQGGARGRTLPHARHAVGGLARSGQEVHRPPARRRHTLRARVERLPRRR